MRTWFMLLVLWLAGGHGGGVTNTDGEDLSEYWAEDFKVSGHLFAKTSDKDLYGATLPPSVIYDVTPTNSKADSLEKTERAKYGDLTQASSTYPYNYGQVHKKQAERGKKETADIGYSDYKPYGQGPQVYKPLEHQKNEEFPYSSFKPYFGIGTNYGSDVYGNIKDVFSTSSSEKAIGTASEETPEDNRVYATNKARSKVRLLRGNGLQSRTKCRAGICRKKAKNTNRVYPRPTKRIKKIVYNY